MSPIEWKASYSVNDATIDEQHKNLVAIINKLIEARDRHEANRVVWEVLNELLDYTRVHFSAEEEYMKAHSYPKLREHKEVHYELMKKVLEFHGAFWTNGWGNGSSGSSDGSSGLAADLGQFLKGWLTEHIIHEDQHYARFVAKNG